MDGHNLTVNAEVKPSGADAFVARLSLEGHNEAVMMVSAAFRYFHEGRLFAIESRIDSPRRGPLADPEYMGSPHRPQYFWLCSSCCRAMTVQSDGDHEVTIMQQGMLGNVSVMEDRTQMVA